MEVAAEPRRLLRLGLLASTAPVAIFAELAQLGADAFAAAGYGPNAYE